MKEMTICELSLPATLVTEPTSMPILSQIFRLNGNRYNRKVSLWVLERKLPIYVS